jgi:hypothetical protein
MSENLGPFQKVVITEQTTGKYGIVMYEVEMSEKGYMYGVDEIKENIYVDEIEYENDISGETIQSSEINNSTGDFKRVIIESENIQVKKNSEEGYDIARIKWSSDKNSMYEKL